MSIGKLTAALEQRGILFRERLSLRAYSTLRVGGVARLAVFPANEEELALTVRLLREEALSFEVLGKGSNVLFGDGVIETVMIFTERLSSLWVEGNRLRAQAGVSLAALAALAAEQALSGLEFARGIPGSLGGAIFMNAGAYGGSISDVLSESLALDTETGEIQALTEHGFGYRTGRYMKQKTLICLGGTVVLSEGDRDEILEKMRELAVSRREKQPLEYPSAGSYFKRPEGYFAGKLIEDCGLKGARIGDAAISEKHAGFLINLGTATAEDVLRLEERVRGEVEKRFGVLLEREVRLIR